MVKKILGVLLAVVFIIMSIPSITYAAETVDKDLIDDSSSMDALDIMIATYRVLAATTDGEDAMWDSIDGISSVEPLYNLDKEIIAYYLTFEPSGYVIINNNQQNPVIMEYSSEDYFELDQLIQDTKISNQRNGLSNFVCYGGTLNCFTFDDAIEYIGNLKIKTKSDEALLQLDNLYSFMQTKNESVCDEQQALRRYIVQRYMGTDYGVRTRNSSYTVEELKELYCVVEWNNMPSGAYTAAYLSDCGLIDYGTTGEFGGLNGAHDHCAATAAFNVVAYYSDYLDAPDLYVNGDKDDTFIAIHEYIGNGPVLFNKYNDGLSNYVTERGYTYHYSISHNYAAVKSGIDSHCMSTLILAGSLASYHMVNVVGYREYSAGFNYMRIVDGWENTTQRFIISTNMMSGFWTWIS